MRMQSKAVLSLHNIIQIPRQFFQRIYHIFYLLLIVLQFLLFYFFSKHVTQIIVDAFVCIMIVHITSVEEQMDSQLWKQVNATCIHLCRKGQVQFKQLLLVLTCDIENGNHFSCKIKLNNGPMELQSLYIKISLYISVIKNSSVLQKYRTVKKIISRSHS